MGCHRDQLQQLLLVKRLGVLQGLQCMLELGFYGSYLLVDFLLLEGSGVREMAVQGNLTFLFPFSRCG